MNDKSILIMIAVSVTMLTAFVSSACVILYQYRSISEDSQEYEVASSDETVEQNVAMTTEQEKVVRTHDSNCSYVPLPIFCIALLFIAIGSSNDRYW